MSSSVLQFDSNLIDGLGAKWLVVLKVIQETQWSLPKEQQGCQDANWDTKALAVGGLELVIRNKGCTR